MRDNQKTNAELLKEVESLRKRVAKLTQTEKTLRESEEKWRGLLNDTLDIIMIVGRDGTISFINHTVPGLTKQEVIGQKVYDYISPEHHDMMRKHLKSVFQKGRSTSHEISGVGRHGDLSWYQAEIGPIRKDGHIVAASIITRDITDRRRTEDALRESEKRFRDIFENIAVGVYRTTPDGQILMANSALVHMLGYSSFEELNQRNLEKQGFEPQYERSIFKEKIEREGRIVSSESTWITRDGKKLHVIENARAVRDEDGNTLYYEGTAENITERKQAEEMLRLRNVAIESSINGISFVDIEGNLIYVNDSFLKLWGYSDEKQVLGKPAVEFWIDVDRAAEIRKIVSNKGNWTGELVARRKDGSTFDVELSASLVKDENANPVCLMASFIDITERRRAEDALRESEEKYRQLVSTTTDSVMLFDAETRNILDVNKACEKLYGYSREEFLNLRQKDITAELRKSEETIQQVVNGGPKRIPLRYHRKKDGTIFPVEITGSMFELAGRKVLCGVIRDITERKQAEKKLQESEVQLRRAQEVAHIGSWYLDLRTGQLMWSDETYRIFGVPKGKPLKETDFLAIVHPDDKSYVEQSWAAALRGEQYDIEHRILKGGIVKWVQEKAELEFDAEGKPVSGIGTVQDITTRKKTEVALRESERKYRTVFQGASEGIIVADTETKEFKYVNPAICKMLGYNEEELIQLGVRDIVPKEDLEHVISEFEAQARGEITLASNIPCLRKDGTIMYANINAAVIIIEGRKCNVGFFTDVTERKKAEDEVEKFREMAERAPFGCAMAVPNGNITYVNNTFAKMHGYTPSELIGKNLKICHTDKQIKHVGRLAKRLVETGEGVNGEEIWHVHRDGTEFLTLMSTWILKEPDGNPHLMCGTAVDITEHKQAEEELNEYREKMARAEQLASVGALSAIMAHTLNDLLTVIQLSIQDAMEESKKTSRQSTITKYLKEGLRSVSEVSSTVHSLGKFASESSKDIISKVNLKAVAERTVKLLSESARRTKMSLHLEGMGELPPIYSNERGLEQLFFSLAENAIQAADGKKSHRLIISGAVKDKHIELRFTDDCGGIAKNILDKIYEPFFTTKPAGERTGLGLCIVERNVSEAGGKIRVESKAGKGTTFFVTLPLGKGERS
jgi:PAS domain S-box-containing protein